MNKLAFLGLGEQTVNTLTEVGMVMPRTPVENEAE